MESGKSINRTNGAQDKLYAGPKRMGFRCFRAKEAHTTTGRRKLRDITDELRPPRSNSTISVVEQGGFLERENVAARVGGD